MAAARRRWPPNLAEIRRVTGDWPPALLPDHEWTPGELLKNVAEDPVALRARLESQAQEAAELAGRYMRGFTLVELLIVLAAMAALALWLSK